MEHMIVVDFIGTKEYTVRGLIGKADYSQIMTTSKSSIVHRWVENSLRRQG